MSPWSAQEAGEHRRGPRGPVLILTGPAAAKHSWLPVAATEASVAKIGEILDAMPDCTPLQTLRANKRLADLLADRRAGVVEAALEQEASWADIGQAMGMTEERARDWYRTVTDPGYVSDHQDAFIERVFRQDHDDD